MFNFDEITNRSNTQCIKYDALEKYFGDDNLQPFWVADMDFKTPDFVNDAIIKRAMHPIYGYAKVSQELLASVQSWMKKRHNWEIQTHTITFMNGVVPAYSAAIEAFSEIGDEVIVQTPVYFPLFNCVKHNKRNIVYNPLKESNGYYTMDLEDLKSKITPKTKILALCSPHNPVGRVWDKSELKKLAQICIEHDIKIISDEIHADLVFKTFTPMASISKKIANITLTLSSAGKTFNIAGLNCSYSICSNKQMQKRFEEIIHKREIHSVNVFGYAATQAAYEKGEKWVDNLLVYLKKNVQTVKKSLENTKITFFEPEATYLLWLNFSCYNYTHNTIKKLLLEESKVALNDGLSFGRNGAKHFRLNVAAPSSILKQGLEKINRVF
ncbi:MAG: MalY/PatB family protein [Candidatus Marinarcus sp.]|uniref:MalY/PatB family protein n=1 Tax=Candidatus Marinarcus sp. TaxID=3100987 RepID=UPI003B003515